MRSGANGAFWCCSKRLELAHRLADWIALWRSERQPGRFNRAVVKIPKTIVIRIKPYLVEVLVWRSETDEWFRQFGEGTVRIDHGCRGTSGQQISTKDQARRLQDRVYPALQSSGPSSRAVAG